MSQSSNWVHFRTRPLGRAVLDWCLAALLFLGWHIGSGAEFVNLDFESANLPVLPSNQLGDYVSIDDALPFWSGYLGENPVLQILHNNITLGSGGIWIWGPDYPAPRLEGDFTIVMVPGSDVFGSGVSENVSLRQSGVIPSDSQSITFKGIPSPFSSAHADLFAVFIDGEDIPLTALETGTDYTLYGGDISGFAGMEVELQFDVFWNNEFSNELQLDDIQFSPEPIPEPGSFTLMSLGLALCGWLAGRRRPVSKEGSATL